MRIALAMVLVIFTAMLHPAPAHAVPAEELLRRANESSARSDWNASARSLEELVSAGIDSSDVLYDLGTVYAHAGRYGEAIWRFEQVVRRSLFASDAQQNLRASRLLLAHRDAARSGRAVVETATPFGTWLGEILPLDWAVFLAVIAELCALGCLWVYRRRNHGETSRVAGAAGAIMMSVTAIVFGAIVVARQSVPPAAIVLRDGLHLLRSPAADAIPDASVREGERVELLGHESSFVRVRTPAGQTGWLGVRDTGSLED